MKKVSLNRLISIIFMLLILAACEKEDMVINPDLTGTGQNSFEVPLLVQSDNITETNPETISPADRYVTVANHETLKYSYDKNGRLAWIFYYVNTADELAASNSQVVPAMTDRFEYNTNGRLALLLRSSHNSATDNPVIRKSYIYDRSGKLVQIITEKSELSVSNTDHLQIEQLFYTNTGLLYRKDVKTPDGKHYFLYKHDENNRLKIEALFTPEGAAKYYCVFNYDAYDNVAWKEYFYPNSTTDAVSGWIEKFEYDRNPNPYKDMKLPVSSLFENMDVISGNNFTMIANPIKTVYFRYKYEINGYPILRVRFE
ncbi:MAG: hypothetical protein JXB00_13615 [Bacteroidales bacterium]|nr:hypothetical protein [Bacteroidales bacterium]